MKILRTPFAESLLININFGVPCQNIFIPSLMKELDSSQLEVCTYQNVQAKGCNYSKIDHT